MWSQYAKGGDGIAVVSSTALLIRALAAVADSVYIGRVKYVDYSKTLFGIPGNVFTPCMRKRLGFEHEKEVRALIEHDWQTEEAAPPGLGVRIDLTALVDCIMIAPAAPSWMLPLVESLVAKYDYKFRVFQSKMLSPPADIDMDLWKPLLTAMEVASKLGGSDSEKLPKAPAPPVQ